MTIRLAALASVAALAAATPAHADSTDRGFTFSGDFRARLEGIADQYRPAPYGGDSTLLLRTDLAAAYDSGPLIFGGEVIDSRAYFEHRVTTVGTGDVNALEPVQLYVKTDISDRYSLEAGRFTMALGSGRLVARPSFRNDVNGFTGARFDANSRAGDAITLFYTLPQSRLPSDADAIRHNDVELDRERWGLQFFGAFGSTKRIAGATTEAYLYRLSEDDAPRAATRNRHLWTLGGRIYSPHKAGTYDYEVEGAYQWGHERGSTAATDLTDLDVSAGFFHAQVGRTFAGAWKPRVQLAFDYASGDGTGGRYTRFDTLFGSHTAEFGPSDLYNLVAEANLVSPEARVEVVPNTAWDGYLAVRPLWLANDTDSFGNSGLRDATGRSGDYAGTQLEARARRWLIPKTLRLTAGAAYLIRGRFLAHAPNAPDDGDAKFGYLEADYSF